ncbi:hypothetical protein V8F33_010302 [Rhypophila sp. PSN 637]
MDQTYAQLMTQFSNGRCLYRPPSTTAMLPGSVGYWDSNAKWQRITQLDDIEDLKAKGFKPPQEELNRQDSKLDEGWSPLHSSSVTESDITAEIKTKLPESVVAGKAFLKYQSTGNSGAVLITRKPISSRGFPHESPFTRWVRDNIDALMGGPRGEDIKRHGLIIIRDTYSTKQCLLSVWNSGSRSVSVGLTVDAQGALDLGVGGGWSHATEAGGWRHFYSQNEKDEVVVFASGFYYRVRWLFGINFLPNPEPLRSVNIRGKPTEVSQIKSREKGDAAFELEREVFGNPPTAAVEAGASDTGDDEEEKDDGCE